MTRFYVLFASSFRCPSAPNISHETIDKEKTLCGRMVSDSVNGCEPDDNDLDPDCITCQKVAKRLKAGRATEVEAQVKCKTCSRGHAAGSLQKPCFVTGCECWCNR